MAFAGSPMGSRLLLVANPETSRLLCWARFAPLCSQGSGQDCLIKVQGYPSSPSFFTLFRCLHILPLHIIPHPPYTYTNSLAELGPAKEPAPKIHSHWGHTAPRLP